MADKGKRRTSLPLKLSARLRRAHYTRMEEPGLLGDHQSKSSSAVHYAAAEPSRPAGVQVTAVSAAMETEQRAAAVPSSPTHSCSSVSYCSSITSMDEEDDMKDDNSVGRESAESSRTGILADCPPDYLCPISQQLMHDPVLTPTGETFERVHIAKWLSRHTTCPATLEQMQPPISLVPNRALRRAIQHWAAQRGMEVRGWSDETTVCSPHPDALWLPTPSTAVAGRVRGNRHS